MTRAHRLGIVTVALVTVLAGLGVAPPSAAVSPAHWIGIRPNAAGGTELYDTRSGARFVPRGVNLLKDDRIDGSIIDRIVAPGGYDQAWLDRQLAHIGRLGFNTIRVWLDHCPGACLTNPDGSAKPAWLDNVAALLQTAKAHGLVVVLVSNELPEVGYLDQMPCCSPIHPYFNGQILSALGLKLTRVYWRTIIGGLLERGAPLEVVLGYELLNETFFFSDTEPLSLAEGLVTTANGQTYDMTDPLSKAAMLDDGLIFWADQVRSSIRALDPTALVTDGFFAPNEPNSLGPDNHVVRTQRFIRESAMDFLDFHAYPDLALYLDQIVENFTLDASVTKPVVMGEYGSIVPAHPDAAAAAAALVRWQDRSCDFGFDGWLGWVWGSLDPSVLQLTDDGAVMARAISPSGTPDPCNPPRYRVNLAFQRPVSVAAELPDHEAARAVDGLALTDWNSGLPAPAQIVIDLGGPRTIHEIRLLTSQDPAGSTIHRIEVRRPLGGWLVLATLAGVTTGEQWLRVFPAAPVVGVRWIRVRTISSPSWISWREIQAY